MNRFQGARLSRDCVLRTAVGVQEAKPSNEFQGNAPLIHEDI